MKKRFNINRFLRSKAGLATIVGLVAVLLIVVIIVGVSGLTGTAGLPSSSLPVPTGGYTCFPSCEVNDGRLLVLPGSNVASFGGSEVKLWIVTDGTQATFEIGFFDGDSGKTSSGALNWREGNWDTTNDEVIYTLYADPIKNGKGAFVVKQWKGNEMNMPNNAWFSDTVTNVDQAKTPNGLYAYMFKAERIKPLGTGLSNFKLRSSGYLSVGGNLGNFAFSGNIPNFKKDVYLVYLNYTGNVNNPGSSRYDGVWVFKFYVPNDQELIELWNGDFDRGNSKVLNQDTDDPNTEGKPAWAVPNFTNNEGAGGQGMPADDYSMAVYRRSPAVKITLIDPDGAPIYTDEEPSGTEEWERFTIATKASYNPDLLITERAVLKAGYYTLVIEGLDLSNTVWLRTNYEMCDPDDECKPVWPEGSCPRTIGYWKNNFKKVLDGAKAQETRASLEWGLRNTALASQIFQKGLVSADLQTINVAVQTSNQPLTLEEAYKILQRSTNQQSPYFTNLEANSMMARALQQNLATWMNLATGKIGPTTVVRLTGIAGGDFNGTVEQALQEAEQRILNNDNLERAKDIADMINNNSLNQDPANVIPCEEYNKPTGPIPSDKQPPAHEKMPKAPKPENKKESDTPPTTPEDPATCTGRTNTYQVENTTNNPFFSIKFNFASGTEIKEGLYEEFRYSLPADTVAGISQMQVEAKAGEESRTVTLACDFTSPLPCDAVKDADGLYTFQFMGAEDQGDGTLELVFQVYVHGQYGLSHASFELPGIAASAPASGSYEAKVCQP